MFDEGNAQLSAVGFFNPMMGGGDSVSVGGGAGGGVIDGVFGMSEGKIVNCHIMVGRTLVSCGDTALGVLSDDPQGLTDGTAIYAKVRYQSGWQLSVHDDGLLQQGGFSKENTLDTAYRILYVYSGGSWVDCRWMPQVVAMD